MINTENELHVSETRKPLQTKDNNVPKIQSKQEQ